jgi:hypothetical protein
MRDPQVRGHHLPATQVQGRPLTGQELTDGECSGEADPTYTLWWRHSLQLGGTARRRAHQS